MEKKPPAPAPAAAPVAPAPTREWKDPRSGSEYVVHHCYTDTLGHHWYEFEEPLQMPSSRGVETEFAAEWAMLHLTPDDLLAFIDKLKEQGSAGKVVDMFGTLTVLEARVKAQADMKSLSELAKAYFLIDDEPLGNMTVHHNELKEDVWRKDPEARGFFLQRVFASILGFSQFSALDILTYFRDQETLRLKTPDPTQPSVAPKTGGPTPFMQSIAAVRKSTRKRT